jgi:hypothetical protein
MSLTVNSIAYSSALVPYLPLCAASLVIARALELGALAIDYNSAHALFHRPVLGRTDRIDIPWKEAFLNETLFPLKYAEFLDAWQRCLFVLGCRKPIRPYAMRVGAGARMDGMPTPQTLTAANRRPTD